MVVVYISVLDMITSGATLDGLALLCWMDTYSIAHPYAKRELLLLLFARVMNLSSTRRRHRRRHDMDDDDELLPSSPHHHCAAIAVCLCYSYHQLVVVSSCTAIFHLSPLFPPASHARRDTCSQFVFMFAQSSIFFYFYETAENDGIYIP